MPASNAHSSTNNSLPDKGVKGRFKDNHGRIYDRGIVFMVEFKNGEEVHVSKDNHPSPVNLRQVMKEASEKRTPKSINKSSQSTQSTQSTQDSGEDEALPTGTPYSNMEESPSW